MLVTESEQFIPLPFNDEDEIEKVVERFSENLFGSSIIYLSKAYISTIGGKSTFPDAIVIDVERGEWYVIEVELSIHGTWNHIAPQISVQLAAVASSQTKDRIIQIALNSIKNSNSLKNMLSETGIDQLEMHGRLQSILSKQPIVAIPIDGVPKDLLQWIETLRHTVKIWVLEKYVSTTDSSKVIYSIPDENLPTLITSPASKGSGLQSIQRISSQPLQDLLNAKPELLDMPLILEYGPRGQDKKTFSGVLKKQGIEVDGVVRSPSYAAVYCMKKTGSHRETANGWIMWKTPEGEYLDDLYQKYVNADNMETLS
jgi:hypothetical protein